MLLLRKMNSKKLLKKSNFHIYIIIYKNAKKLKLKLLWLHIVTSLDCMCLLLWSRRTPWKKCSFASHLDQKCCLHRSNNLERRISMLGLTPTNSIAPYALNVFWTYICIRWSHFDVRCVIIYL